MASEAILKQKSKVVSEIANKIKESSSVIFVDYRGLTVDEITELRRKLRETESDLKVYKNTLTKRAVDDLKIDLGDNLAGPSAVTFSKDVVSPAKILNDFAKKHKALKIKVGIIDGKVSGLDIITELASIPSYEGLLTMLAGSMLGTVRDLTISLNLYQEQKEEIKETIATSEENKDILSEEKKGEEE